MARGKLAQLLKAKRGAPPGNKEATKGGSSEAPKSAKAHSKRTADAAAAAVSSKRGRVSQHGGPSQHAASRTGKARIPAQQVEDPGADDFDLPKLDAGAAAYNALMGIFSKQGKHSQALRQLQLEREGESEEDSDEGEEGDESEEELSSEGSDDDLEAGAGDEQGNDDEDDDDNGDDDDLDPLASKPNMKAGNGFTGEPTSQVASRKLCRSQETSQKPSRLKAKGSSDAAAAAVAESEAEAVMVSEPTLSAAEVTAYQEKLDRWHAHMSREVTDTEAALLQETKAPKFNAAPEHPDWEGSWPAGQWQVDVQKACLPDAPISQLSAYGVKERLQSRWLDVQKADQDASGQAGSSGTDAAGAAAFVSTQQRTFFSLLNSYADIFLPARSYPAGPKLDAEADPLMDACILHCLNHVAKASDRIKKNNDRLAAVAAEGASAKEEVPRDQGFTRPKVLFLLPQRNCAYKLVRRLVTLAMKETRADSVSSKERFVEQFTDADAQPEEEMDEKAKARRAAKPNEWRALFDGNVDDHFRMGIKITRGAIRLFSDFMQSDIIVASPIALATKLAEEGGGAGAADFLSSIEVLVVDRADMMIMQNWAHVECVMEQLNQLPKQQHGTDIMRVREGILSGYARHYRQTILLSSFQSADMNAMFSRLCSNYEGRYRLDPDCQGELRAVIPQVQQMFERFPCSSPTEAADARFSFFKQRVWPRLKEASGYGLIIFLPNYFDFVRVRNFLKVEDADFASISEYTEPPDVTAARSRFFHRKRRILLYTERTHFYHRHRIRGIKDIVMYSLPEHGNYYSELVNLLEDASVSASQASGGMDFDGMQQHATVSAIFSRFDVLQLSRIVGKERSRRMLSSESSTFMFC